MVVWGVTVFDTDGFWNEGNLARLTVPAGVSKARLRGNIGWGFDRTGQRHLGTQERGAVPRRREGKRRRQRLSVVRDIGTVQGLN